MTFIIKKASKSAKKLKLGFSAPSGGGKTYGALLAAFGITNDWSKIIVIDTERRSSHLYADLGPFEVLELDAPFSPLRYIEAIKFVESQKKYDVLIIDSISHEWMGKGGCLEIVEALGGSFRDWGKVTPLHNKFIDSMLESPLHVFCTIRRKEEYAMSSGSDGKMTVKKMGLGEVQRDGISYELDVVFDIDINHHATASKDRTGLYKEKESFIITEETGKQLLNWSKSGSVNTNLEDAMNAMRKIQTSQDFVSTWKAYSELHTNEDFKGLAKKMQEYVKSKNENN